MKTTGPVLTAFLNSARQAALFDLWTFTLSNGSVLRYTDSDVDVWLPDGRVFTRGPIITRDRVRWVRGIEVDQLSVRMAADSTVTINGTALIPFIAAGGFDGATAVLDRVYLDDANMVKGWLNFFAGQVADIDIARMEATLKVKSQLVQLNQAMPRNLYQAACLNDLSDANCGINRLAISSDFTINAVATWFNPSVYVTDAQPSGHWDLGICTMTSGPNAGQERTVQIHLLFPGNVCSLQFARPFPFTPQVGDTLRISAGCNKTPGICNAKFGNLLRFRGQPYVPVPETVT